MNFRRIASGILAAVMASSLLCAGGLFAEGAENESGAVFNAPRIPDDYDITIDGKLDSIWFACEPQAINKTDDTKSYYVPHNTTGTLRIMWNMKGVYVFVEVDKHGLPVYFDSSTKDWGNLVYCSDCVQFGWSLSALNWSCPADSTIPYNGGVVIDCDGDISRGGWYWQFGEPFVKGVMRQTAEDKYCVELFIDWVNPFRDDVYGAAGVGEGSCFCFDACIATHDPECTTGGGNGSMLGITSWSMKPYNRMEGCLDFGWVVLAEEPYFDPDEIEKLAEEYNKKASDDVTTPVTDGDVTDNEPVTDSDTDKTAEQKDNKKDNKNDNSGSPKTFDTASALTVATVMLTGAALIIKKKHR